VEDEEEDVEEEVIVVAAVLAMIPPALSLAALRMLLNRLEARVEQAEAQQVAVLIPQSTVHLQEEENEAEEYRLLLDTMSVLLLLPPLHLLNLLLLVTVNKEFVKALSPLSSINITSSNLMRSSKVPEAEEEVEETLIEVEEVAVVLEAEEEDQAAGLR
jgi:hypothetical protein